MGAAQPPKPEPPGGLSQVVGLPGEIAKGFVRGVTVDPVTGKASAKPYEKSYSAGKSGQQDRVMTGDKKIAKSSSTKKGIDFGKKELRKEFVRDSTNIMNRRVKNANKINVSAGNKENLTKEDLESMQNRKNVN